MFEINKTWTLFLDRDGVINSRKMNDYVYSIEEFEFLPKVKEAISFFTEIFGKIIVVTNQQGIGKNLMTKCNLSEIHRYMLEEIKKSGGEIHAVYFAPELKSDINSTRKPKADMALQAQKDFPEINFEKSIMVGDTDSDILFGTNLGMKTVRILSDEKIGVEANLNIESLYKLKELWSK
jgi:D-glycero-D-manno-heptose 1,7-bisphosphate phosphatase